jgi:hypothetical protein
MAELWKELMRLNPQAYSSAPAGAYNAMGDTIRRLWPRSHKQQLHQIPLAQRFANNYWAPLATTSKHKKKEHEEVAVIVARHSTL